LKPYSKDLACSLRAILVQDHVDRYAKKIKKSIVFALCNRNGSFECLLMKKRP